MCVSNRPMVDGFVIIIAAVSSPTAALRASMSNLPSDALGISMI